MRQLISVRHVISDLWEQILSSKPEALLGNLWDNHRDVALYFKLGLSLDSFGYDNTGTQHLEWKRRYDKVIHIIVTARHRVYVATVNPSSFNGADSEYLKSISPNLFKNISNHDSEWSSALESSIQEELTAAYDHCYGMMPRDLRPAPCTTSIFTSFGEGLINRSVLNFVKIKRKDLGDHYFDGLQEITQLRIKMSLEPEEA